MSEGYSYLEIDSVSGDKLSFRKAAAPGALVEVRINDEVVQLRATSLILALAFFAEEGE